MKRTSELSNKTKAELTTMARRKKIPVASGMIKDELIKAIQKGLRKIEAKKNPKQQLQKPANALPLLRWTSKLQRKRKRRPPELKLRASPPFLKKVLQKEKQKKLP